MFTQFKSIFKTLQGVVPQHPPQVEKNVIVTYICLETKEPMYQLNKQIQIRYLGNDFDFLSLCTFSPSLNNVCASDLVWHPL